MTTTSVRPPAADVMTRQQSRDPDWALLALAWVAMLWSLALVLVLPMGRSIADLALAGAAMDAGSLAGTGWWSLRAPGLPLLLAALQKLFGSTLMPFRLLEVFALVGWVYVARRFAQRFSLNTHAGLLGGALLCFVHAQLEFEHTGQPELFASLALALASTLTWRDHPGRRRWFAWTGIGLLLGAALFCVPSFVLATLPIAWNLWRSERARSPRRLDAVAGLALVSLLASLPWALFLGYLSHHSGLTGFAQNWLTPQLALGTLLPWDERLAWGYYVLDRLVLRQSAIIPCGLVLCAILPSLHQQERAATRWVMLMVGAMWLAFTFNYESNPGRLSGALPWLALPAGLGVYKLWRKALLQGPGSIACFGAGLVLLALLNTAVSVPPGSYWHRSWLRTKYLLHLTHFRAPELLEEALYDARSCDLPASRRVAAELRQQASPQASVFVQGDAPQVLWFSHHRAAGPLLRPLPDNIAKAAPEVERYFDARLAQLSPEFVVVPPTEGPSYAGLARRLALPERRLAEEYTVTARVEGWSILERNRR